MRPVLLLGVLLALLTACSGKEKTCNPNLNPNPYCTEYECGVGSNPCVGSIYECEDGEWVLVGYCDYIGPYIDAGLDAAMDGSAPDAGPDVVPDAGIDGSIPDAGPGTIPDAGTGTDAPIL